MKWAIYIQDYPKAGDKMWCHGEFSSWPDEYGYLNRPLLFQDINLAHQALIQLNIANPGRIGQYHIIEYPPNDNERK